MNRFRRPATAALTLTVFLCATSAAGVAAAQAAAPSTAPLPPPSAGLLVSYQYWPTQYIQWIAGPELPYSMVEFDVDSTGKQPLYHAVLTGKDGARTHYSSVDRMAAAYKAQGEASYKTEFAYDTDETGKPGSTTTIRFSMGDGKPFEWRFVQGSDMSAQGSGLTPLPQAPLPVFAYRELGAVAGEGTAVKIGDVVSTAEMWKEISHPPYFVGYRGAVTSGAHMLVFTKGTESWKIVKAPTALATGSTWELDSDTGNHRTLVVGKTDGTHATVTVTERFRPMTTVVLDGSYAAATGWTVDHVRYSPAKDSDKHGLSLSFSGTTPATGTMDLIAGKKTNLATAMLERGGDALNRTEAVKFTAPKWAADKQLNEALTTTEDALTVTAK